MEPTEGEYDLTAIYDFIVQSDLGGRERGVTGNKYWLTLRNEKACLALAKLLKELMEAHA